MSAVRNQSLAEGTRLDSFEIRDVLGSGGFGITYRAWDHHLACDVAIKEFFPSDLVRRDEGATTLVTRSSGVRTDFETGLTRFLDEARTLARFREPSIVRVNRFLEANGTAYLVMDLEQGRPLSNVISSGGPVDEPTARRLLPALLRGLGVVHEAGILHRDIKPSNLMIRPSGDPVLLDFGAAREARPSGDQALTAMITPGYAPIEQYGGGDRQGPWTDLYALGATFYHAIVGSAPHDSAQRLSRASDGLPDSVEHGLRSVRDRFEPPLLKTVYWLLKPHAKDRPRTAVQVMNALERLGVVSATEVKTMPSTTAPTRSAAPSPASESKTMPPTATPADDPDATRLAALVLPEGEAGRVESCLAGYIGPIAGLLVERAAGEAKDLAEFHSLLAAEIDDADERALFLASVGRP